MVRFRPASHDYTLQFSLTKRIILYISDLKYVYNCTLVICTYPTRRTCLLFISDLLHEITVHRRPVTCKNCALQTCTRDKYTSQNCYTWHLYTQTGYTWQLYIADWLHVTTVQFRPVTRDNCTFQTCYTWQLYISDLLHVTTVHFRLVTRDNCTRQTCYTWQTNHVVYFISLTCQTLHFRPVTRVPNVRQEQGREDLLGRARLRSTDAGPRALTEGGGWYDQKRRH